MARQQATTDDRNLESTSVADELDGAGIDGVWADYRASDQGVNVHLGDVDDRGLVIPENVSGGYAEGDQLTGIQNIHGSAYNDSIRADSGDNMVRGHQGNDEIFGRHGDDDLWGGTGHDVIYGDLGDLGRPYDPQTDLNFDRISNNDDTLRGGVGRDHLYGQFGNDELEGGADADFLDGDHNQQGLGGTMVAGVTEGARGLTDRDADDVMDGDTVSYITSDAAVNITLGEGSYEGMASGGHAEGDRIFNFENIRGSNHDDALTGNTDHNKIWGRGGDDMIDGGIGNDTIWGHEGDDTIMGGDGDDIIQGNAGDDEVMGGAGNDSTYIPHISIALSRHLSCG